MKIIITTEKRLRNLIRGELQRQANRASLPKVHGNGASEVETSISVTKPTGWGKRGY